MPKRTPPLAVAFIGTGEASPKVVQSLLTDYTSPYAEVTFVLPVADDYWTDTLDSVAEWATENDVPYVAVTDGNGVNKKLQPVLDGAADTLKVARISTKLVSLLKQEQGEGDVALLVAWDDDDAEANLAVNKALSSEIRAFNLLDGLDEFSFDEEGEAEVAEEKAAVEELEAEQDEDGKTSKDRREERVGDDYDDLGIRKLRALLRERADEHDIPDKLIGQLDKDDAIRALRNVDNGKGKSQPGVSLPAEEPEEEGEPQAHSGRIAKKILDDKAERTTRARRAFAEGASEGRDDEAQALPRSRGGDVLEDQDNEPADPVDEPETGEGELQDVPEYDEDATGGEVQVRATALTLAVQAGLKGAEALALARTYEAFIRGEKRGPGRPRKDGTPAQPREIDPETGKVKRRRYGA